MTLSLQPTQRLALMLECPVCLHNRTAEDFPDGYTNVVIFGLVASYMVCPHCLQEVEAETIADEDYRRRCRVGYFERFGLTFKEQQ